MRGSPALVVPPAFAVVISLADLANWESRLHVLVARADGDCEARDRLFTQHGVYAEYAAVFGSYARLVSEDAEGLEALKRAAFLAWYGSVEPACLTGIADLPESGVRAVLEALDLRCREPEPDAELALMVAWYAHQEPLVFEQYPGLAGIGSVAARTPVSERLGDAEPAQFTGRGLLGRYWSAVLESRRV